MITFIQTNIIKAVSYRLSKLSPNKQIFEDKAGYYNQALAKAGYKDRIQFIDTKHSANHRPDPHSNLTNASTGRHSHPSNVTYNNIDSTNKSNKYRKRKIIWYNPPFGKQTDTIFLKIC